MFAPPIRLPNIPDAPQNPSEWEAALLDTTEGFYGPFNDPFFARTTQRIIPTFYEQRVSVKPTPIPVAGQGWEYVFDEPEEIVRSVLPGPVAVREPAVPRTTVVVAGLPTEVERHPEGDFPAGSIFAPGRAWEDHGLDSPDPVEEEDMALGDILDWGLDTLLGQQDWQIFGGRDPYVPPGFTPSPYVPSSPIPSGSAASPPSAAPYIGAKMQNGDACGNRRYVTLDRETGKISCKRRRRRRLLTNRDLADLASLKTITGGGAALNAAVIRAVR